MIKVGLVGCGRIAEAHINALLRLKDKFSVESVFDAVKERSESFANKYEIPKVKSRIEDLLNDDLDLVSITVPDGLHYEIIKKAFDFNKNVLTEKPLARNSKQIGDVINISRNKNLFLGVVLQKRLFKIFRKIKNEIENGEIGNVFLSSLQQIWYRDDSYFDSSWHGKKKFDGGLILNQSIHNIDLLDWLAGPVIKVRAYGGNVVKKNIETEDTVVSAFETKNGVGNMLLTVASYPKNFGSLIQIFGEKGRIMIGTGKFEDLTTNKFKEFLYELKYPTLSGYGHTLVYNEVFNRLELGMNTEIEAVNLYHSFAVALSLRASAEEKREIKIGDEI